ncbi:glycosyltransferase [Ameyamaea chiangmaiensis NBRC 103196]|uniref:Glycosyltransferase family 39 protein n=1 Tax=Ameyamaea chiangmaiensis TaxID=442969 RepID=A0A850PK32_9PROT|nr:glycosyltransferase family 39 protein [Ameyamaea chiangmaiensis]MBS4075323.1 glycosyltransferase family 39 protein [Ameyamaea chiangmaiensis]NVN41661.1 glycosyltransferase family 39 protein [Ameyamaea chiangmaiensis]GBQ66754.1 glycosyltransferase [Ameyamaea chiangmaiensis NBRC 103196]
MGLKPRHMLALALLVFALFLPGRASLPPFDRDEPRYMEATAQMLRSGNFVDVRFQDKPRYLQPAGIYWLEAVAVKASGVRRLNLTWPYRIPSLLAVVAVVVLTVRTGTVLFGVPAGLLAGGFLATSVLLTAEGRMATIDSMLLLTVMLVECALLRAFVDREHKRPTSVLTALTYWGAIGCGLMLKGPVILIPAFGTPLALAAVERRVAWWSRLRPAWGWLIAIAIVLPWCIAIGVVSHGQFFANAVGTNFLGKVASGQQAHGLPPGYHLGVFAIAFWPGSLFAVAALPAIVNRRMLAPVRFLLCWIVPHWLVFEAIATKLPHYVLPTYPAIAILTGACIATLPSTRFRPASLWGRGLLGAYGLVWLAVGLALSAAGPVLLWRLEHVVSAPALIATGGSLPLILIAAWLFWRQHIREAAWSVMAAAVVIYTGLFVGVLPKLETLWLSPRVAALVDDYRLCPATTVASASYSEPSLVFLVGQDTKLVNAVEAAAFLAHDPSCGLALVDRRDEAAFMGSLAQRSLRPIEYGRVQGLNYSTGRHLDLGLYGLTPP